MGYFFAVRRDLFERLGVRFDEKLLSYAYAEDLDFSYAFIKRAREEGFKAVLDPSIYVNHLGSKEWRLPSQKSLYMRVINRYYLSYKHFKRGYMRVMLIWSDVGEFFVRLLERQQPMSILKAHIICVRKLRLLRRGIIDEELQKMIK
jgi:GT2 family glycosyltransferase